VRAHARRVLALGLSVLPALLACGASGRGGDDPEAALPVWPAVEELRIGSVSQSFPGDPN
jgi:hypothetical protein